MARGDQMGRQWRIIQALISSSTGKSVSELIDMLDLGCHQRTVYRDLEALQKAGFPIYNETLEGKNLWMLMDSAKKKMPVPMNITELMSLYLARDMLKVLKHTVFYDSLMSLFGKIKASLPAELIAYLEQIEKNLHIGHRPYKQYGEFRDTINSVNEALTAGVHMDITYYAMSRKETTRRRVAPYSIWFFDGTFYLIGFCRTRNDIRLFALDRIQTLALTDEPFSPPTDFDAENFMQASFGVFQGEPVRVRIRFSAEVAGYIREKTWHDSQVLHPLDDGSLIFEAHVAGTDEIKFWVLSWGASAVVLEPESLIQEIRTELDALNAAYPVPP